MGAAAVAKEMNMGHDVCFGAALAIVNMNEETLLTKQQRWN